MTSVFVVNYNDLALCKGNATYPVGNTRGYNCLRSVVLFIALVLAVLGHWHLATGIENVMYSGNIYTHGSGV